MNIIVLWTELNLHNTITKADTEWQLLLAPR